MRIRQKDQSDIVTDMPDNILPYAKFKKEISGIYERKDLEAHLQMKEAPREHELQGRVRENHQLIFNAIFKTEGIRMGEGAPVGVSVTFDASE